MTEAPTRPHLRVALRVVDGPMAEYVAAAAEAVLYVTGAEVVLILATRPVRASGGRRWHGWLQATYDWFEQRLLRGRSAACDLRHLGPWATGTSVVRGASSGEQVDALRAAAADVLIDLAPDDDVDALPVPPSGRWQLRYAAGVGGARRTFLGPPLRASAGLAESLLSMEVASGTTLEAGVGVGAFRRIGWIRDRDAVYWRSALLPARRLAQLVAGQTVPSVGDLPGLPSGKARSTEHMWDAPPFVGLAMVVIGKVVERVLFRTGWIVLVRVREPDQEPPRDLAGFRPIEAPPGRFFADPFVVGTADGPRLYVEDCPDGVHRGRISALQMAPDGTWALDRVVLDDLEHRAYPHALNTDDGLLISPDSGRGGGVDLFLDRGTDAGLERIGRCLDGVPASDPTLLWHEGRYWLFVTQTGHGMSPWDELHVYLSASIAGPWHPHPLNPVVADVRCARPAGRIFRHRDALIRPGQDCSIAYGQRIVLSAITVLTPTQYEEHEMGCIEPQGVRGVRRTHTYTFDGSIEALDGYQRVLRLPGRAR